MAGNNNAVQHKATWARDKRKGGYLIRVAGPNAEHFAGREVPVERKDGSSTTEKLIALIWAGTDPTTGKAALYSFEPRPRDDNYDDLPF